jgi:hypothetical protein
MKPATNSLAGYSCSARGVPHWAGALVHHDDLVAHGQRLALVMGDIRDREVEPLPQWLNLMRVLRANAAAAASHHDASVLHSAFTTPVCACAVAAIPRAISTATKSCEACLFIAGPFGANAMPSAD